MARRAVIYARYSSENQREASIEDQIEVCRRYAARMGWDILEEYSDAAVSGASAFRPGLSRLQVDARARRFDIVLCEALDRLGRNLADVARLFEELTFLGVQVHATKYRPADGDARRHHGHHGAARVVGPAGQDVRRMVRPVTHDA
jgi:DNA invertase Pin-like site-specific DNA recombinase